jgi:hypothetical protein
MGKFPQLFCLPRRHVEHPNFGTGELTNSIGTFCETAYKYLFKKAKFLNPKKFAVDGEKPMFKG